MSKKTTVLLALFLSCLVHAQWKPQGDKIKTKWASQVDPAKTLPEYPRPIMERSQWKNLNGLWNYSIQDFGKNVPSKYDGQILVPFAVESSLSGVMKEVGAKKELWYETNFSIESNWNNKNILLHFGAVDWKTEVFINDIKVGSHTGGYTPFSFDITPFIQKGKTQKLVVKVWDPSNDGPQPRGKQVKNPEGIWYTPVTGIWQTVWIEPVNAKSITALKTMPNIDQNTISIKADIVGATTGDVVEISVFDAGKEIAKEKAVVGESNDIVLNNVKLWSPENPFLYETKIRLISNNKVVDEVKSYFAMRKIASKRDENGIMRMQLNNKD
jgi:beta-galactosidase/beta-glucuronidase